MRLLYSRSASPHHGFAAYYTYVEKIWGADAVLHFGTHGSLEFMPGKQMGMSETCYPDSLIGSLPNLYYYAANNPSEATIAKRRGYASTISYLTPPAENAGLYKGLKELSELVGSYQQLRENSRGIQIVNAIIETSKQCKGSADFKVTHSSEHNKIAVPALTANPSEFSARIAANSSIVPLMNQDLIRPLDDLVKKYGKGIQDSQLITIDGKVMAVAFMANTQHLYYREDVLKDLGIAVPKTYEEVVAASEKIRASGKMQYPYAAAYKAGWNLAEEFVNMFIGHGGEFFKAGGAQPNINNAKGVATLNMLKKLS